jgi:hypothetical protein
VRISAMHPSVAGSYTVAHRGWSVRAEVSRVLSAQGSKYSLINTCCAKYLVCSCWFSVQGIPLYHRDLVLLRTRVIFSLWGCAERQHRPGSMGAIETARLSLPVHRIPGRAGVMQLNKAPTFYVRESDRSSGRPHNWIDPATRGKYNFRHGALDGMSLPIH